MLTFNHADYYTITVCSPVTPCQPNETMICPSTPLSNTVCVGADTVFSASDLQTSGTPDLEDGGTIVCVTYSPTDIPTNAPTTDSPTTAPTPPVKPPLPPWMRR